MTVPLFQFQGMNNTDINWLVSIGKREKFAPNTILIQEGQIVNSIYFILVGGLSISLAGLNGENQEIARLGNGEIVGEMSWMDHHQSPITALVVDSAEILEITHEKLQIKIKQDHGFAARFYQAMSIVFSDRLRGISDLLAHSKIVPGQPLRKVLLVFNELIDRDIDWIIEFGHKERFSPGQVLIEQGKSLDAIYILLKGNIGIYINIINDHEKISKEVARSASGEILGEMSFITGANASATVKIIETSEVLVLPCKFLSAKLQKDLGFSSRFYRAIAIVLLDRLKDRLKQSGYARIAYDQAKHLNEEQEYQDEIDLDALDYVSLAGLKFDWLLKRLQAN